MLITQLKPKDDVSSMAGGSTVVICCEGCREVHFPELEAAETIGELTSGGKVSAAVTTDYICDPDNLKLQLKKIMDKVNAADTMLVFSCGVGVQTVAAAFEEKKVFAGCDTFALPGYQGVTPLEYDCAQCGECHLNDTGGICPITACSKSLVNGQCGGSKNGKCEVDKDMECGWERINGKLEKLRLIDAPGHPVKVRNFNA